MGRLTRNSISFLTKEKRRRDSRRNHAPKVIPVCIRSSASSIIFFFHVYSPARLIRGFTLSDLLDKP